MTITPDNYNKSEALWCLLTFDTAKPAQVRKLLEEGADPHYCHATNGCTLLHNKNCAENAEVVKVLIEYKIDVNATAKGVTPLMAATSVSVFNVLIQAGANPDMVTAENHSLLHSYAKHRHPDLLRTALKHSRKNINLRNNKGETPLVCAIDAHNIDCVHDLLAHGANPLLKNKEGKTARDLLNFGHVFIANEYGEGYFQKTRDALKAAEKDFNAEAFGKAAIKATAKHLRKPKLMRRKR